MEHNDFERKLQRLRAKEPPAALRERLLSRAQAQAACPRGRRAWRLRLGMAAAVVIALVGDLAVEHVTDTRVAALIGGRPTTVVERDDAALEAARQRSQLLAALLSQCDWR
jgi:hypothetical protein